MFAFSWFEITHKTRNHQGENSSVFIHKMYNENIIKRKIAKLQIRNKESTG